MMKVICCLWILFTLNVNIDGFSFGPYDAFDPGESLFLSPLIREGDIDKAQFLSRVGPLPNTCSLLKSYSGFITVVEEHNSNLFFWFIPSQDVDPKTAPLILFLDGGPGISSLFAVFIQNGPYTINKNLKLVPRDFDWTKRFSMLYVDQPVGTGFSFTDDTAGYAKNQNDIGRDMYSFLLQFFAMFPEYQNNDFYLGGESYAGKYISTISHKIMTENPAANLKINLKGLLIGGGYIDPSTVILSYADYMFQLGLLDLKERSRFQAEADRILQMIRNNDLRGSTGAFSSLFFGNGTYVYNRTGHLMTDNVLMIDDPPEYMYIPKYLSSVDAKRSLNVGNRPYHIYGDANVFGNLYEDFTDTAKPAFLQVLNSNQYKIMLFSGQLDIVVLSPSTVAFIDGLDTWPLLQTFRDTEKAIWRLHPQNKDVAGYATTVGNFTYVIVRGAGHYAPMDQPERALDMVTRFIQNKPFGV